MFLILFPSDIKVHEDAYHCLYIKGWHYSSLELCSCVRMYKLLNLEPGALADVSQCHALGYRVIPFLKKLDLTSQLSSAYMRDNYSIKKHCK